MMLRPNDSWSTCIPQGIATFLHYASRRSAGLRYTTHLHQNGPWLYKLSRGYDAPEVTVAVERIGAEQQAKRAA